MKNKIIFLFLALFFLSGLIPLQSQQSFSLKKDIVVREDEVQESITTFGGNVLIEGKVESVIAFGGTVIVRGKVTDLVGIGSNITLKSTAFIKGDVFSLGGVLDKEPGSIVKGDTIHFKTSEDISKFLKEAFKNIFSVSLIPFILVMKLIVFFIWFLLSLVIAALFARQISFASSQIRTSFGSVFGIGLLSIIIYVGVVIFSALLSFILIGIPLLFFFIIFGLVIQIFGRVVLFYFLGESFLKAFGKDKVSPLVFVIIGLVIATVIRFIPVIGFLFSFCLSIIGWGVVIMTKFGTTENWFKKRS